MTTSGAVVGGGAAVGGSLVGGGGSVGGTLVGGILVGGGSSVGGTEVGGSSVGTVVAEGGSSVGTGVEVDGTEVGISVEVGVRVAPGIGVRVGVRDPIWLPGSEVVSAVPVPLELSGLAVALFTGITVGGLVTSASATIVSPQAGTVSPCRRCAATTA